MAIKRFGPALADCQAAASLQSASPVPKTLLRLARCHLALGDVPACLAALRNLPDSAPGVPDVRRRAEALELHLTRFREARDKDEWGAARLALEQAVEAVEGDVPVQWRCWRVECEVARGSWAGAQTAVRQVGGSSRGTKSADLGFGVHLAMRFGWPPIRLMCCPCAG